MKTAIEYGKFACDAIIRKYKAEDLPPKGAFFYHQGVFLSGMERIYKLSGEKKYFNYIKDYIDSVIDENGEIVGYNLELFDSGISGVAMLSLQMLDLKMPAILLYNLLKETGDKRYEKAIKTVAQSMHFWPVNQYGGYWHMMMQHNQMWLDGAYMIGPLSVMYDKFYNDPILRERTIRQIFLMDDNMKAENGLYYHGWDPTCEAEWAIKENGCSQMIWGRALGWYAVAILDILDYIPKDNPSVPRLKQIEKDLLINLAKYQDENTGMWYQVTDMPEKDGNWLESSCTNLFIYSYAKAIRTGILDREYENVMLKAYTGIVDRLYYDDEGYLVIDDVCIGTCIDSGTYEHYINRERIKNDLHGAGAFVLMCSEMEKYKNGSV